MRARSAPLAGLVWASLALAGPFAAHAASALQAPSPALSCLTPTAAERAPVVYPPELLKRKDGGTVSVELTFTARDQPPSVEVVHTKPVLEDFVQAVRDHVDTYRIPCLGIGAPPVKLRQDYVFVPNDGRKVMASEPRDTAEVDKKALWACLKHPRGDEGPNFTVGAWESNLTDGNVFAKLRFTRPDKAPEITVYAASRGNLRSSVSDYAEDLRLPCLTTEPVEWYVTYQFRVIDGERTVLKDLNLVDLLRASKQPLPTAYFDFGTMGCPFAVRLAYFQPHRPNKISQLETADPARQPFLDWLARLTLNLSERNNTSVLGDSMTVNVPCGKLDL